MTVEFRANEDGPGIVAVDSVEGRQFSLSTDEPVSLTPASCPSFSEPVDAVTTCRIRKITLPYVVPVFVRNTDETLLVECDNFTHEKLPAGEYEIEIAAAIKFFLRVSGPVTVQSLSDSMHISFDETTRVELAAQSYSEGPTATVTTTTDPEDVMAAVSTFGSSLETTSPERSFPSQRGHPPQLEVGSTLMIPDSIDVPETGLEIEVPPELPAVYAVASLSYYLGARVVPGSNPRLLANGTEIVSLADSSEIRGERTGVGTSETNAESTPLEQAVTDVLQHVFVLDCIVRTEGQYPIDLAERRQLEERVDLPLATLYEAPIAERVTTYMDVPLAVTDDLVPTWQLSTHVSPDPDSVEILSYAANTLSLIAVEQRHQQVESVPEPPGYGALIRSVSRETEPVEPAVEPTYSRISSSETLEQAWFGDGRSVNANDLSIESVQNRFTSEPADGPIEIGVVCNEAQMVPEVSEEALYGDRKDLPFDVSSYRNLSCSELRDVLQSDLDFLHYVGHVNKSGFVCEDGTLDASTLETVGVDTFLLNGCRSYDQGQAMIERASIGGIVTTGAVNNTKAIPVGRLIAGLLNMGYSLRSALTVVSQRHTVDGRYTVIGDGGVQIAQSENGTPNLLTIDRASDGHGYDVRITTFPVIGRGMGSCYTPYAPSVDRYFLVGGDLPTLTMSLPDVVSLLSLERVPTVIDGEFRWSTDVAPTELPGRDSDAE